MEELKPCPFCGGECKWHNWLSIAPKGAYSPPMVQCKECGALTSFDSIEAMAAHQKGRKAEMEFAAKAFNTRAERTCHDAYAMRPDIMRFKCSCCELEWEFDSGTRDENEMFFCPKCGAKVVS